MAFPRLFRRKKNGNQVPDWLKEAVKGKKQLLPLLHKIQKKDGFISRERIEYVAKCYEIPLSKLYSIITFFTEFKTRKQGKHIIKVCAGTTCNVKKGGINLNYLEKELGVSAGQTSDDRLFSLEKVNCLGTCSLAPVVEIDGQIYSIPRVEELAKLVQKIKKEELG